MNKKQFDELVSSIKEMKDIEAGRKKASHVYRFDPVDIKRLREQLHVSQSKFAALLGVSPGTLKNWEQCRRRPTGPAQVLLRLIKEDPKTIIKLLTHLEPEQATA